MKLGSSQLPPCMCQHAKSVIVMMSADGKPVEPKQKHQAFSSLFFFLLMSFIMKQDEKKKKAVNQLVFDRRSSKSLDSFKINKCLPLNQEHISTFHSTNK